MPTCIFFLLALAAFAESLWIWPLQFDLIPPPAVRRDAAGVSLEAGLIAPRRERLLR